ncbi:hypothetical protein [Bythopirellula polymerisocia]|uniref:EF hand n=1 Tax=Bythopirellula polymerisocia TaxID=2528003 RepID=A0A5C6CG80_9BACT|nr:hypothetical protein [Bythopirellula polymerisocia]TWU22564.1 hypothetical protein Pla144_40240 [Bythopirellula polymerisocia]
MSQHLNLPCRARKSPAIASGCFVMMAVLGGCSGGVASRVTAPGYSPQQAASKAIEVYDTDKDGFVAGSELDNAPGLKAALKNLETDGDGKVSESEVAERVQAWENQGVGIMQFSCDVVLDGRGLEGATVTFEPDVFLEGVVEAGSATTDGFGSASPRIPKENRRSPTDPPGMQLGIYKVRISKIVGGKEIIPPQYNSETTLGQEVAKDDRSIMNKKMVFYLKSR